MSNQTKPTTFDIKVVKSMWQNFIRINRLIWHEKKWLLMGILALYIINSTLPFIQSGANALLINELIRITGGGEITNTIYYLMAAWLITYTGQPLLISWDSHLSLLFWHYLQKVINLSILEKSASLDVATHENPQNQDLIHRVFEGNIWRVQNFVDRQFYIITNLVELIIASAILFYAQWWILAIILLGTIPNLISEIKYGNRVWSIWNSSSETRRRYSDVFWRFRDVSSITELKIYQNIAKFINIIKNLFDKFDQEEIENERIKVRWEILTKLISQITLAVAFIYFIYQVLNGQLQIGTLTFMIASISTFRNAISGLFLNIARQYQDNLFVSETFAMLDLQPTIVSPHEGVKIKPDQPPLIEFQHVYFRYPDTKPYVLRDFNLTIKPGEKIAIIGVNGAGKTTLIKLLCRFYDVTKGKILINGINIKEIDLDSWYHIIGALFQDYEHYFFPAKEVISLGRSTQAKRLSKIVAAATRSGADSFIRQWDKQYNQMLGKNFTGGIQPSVGQWQKISLARTFYRQPQIMILDEPTASIDAEAEAQIFDQLNQMKQQHTLILISHRFSTVRHADKICVIKSGRLAEYGTHEELLKKKQTYARLFNLQAKGYK